MEREGRVGLVLLAAAIALLLITALVPTQRRLSMMDVVEWATRFGLPHVWGSLVYNETVPPEDLEGRQLVLQVEVDAGGIKLCTDERVGYSIRVFGGGEGDVDVDKVEEEGVVRLVVRVDSSFAKIAVNPHLVREVRLEVDAGGCELRMDGLEGVRVVIDSDAGYVDAGLVYLNASGGEVRLDLTSGFADMDLAVPADAPVYVVSNVTNGFVHARVEGVGSMANGGGVRSLGTRGGLEVLATVSTGFSDITVKRSKGLD